MGSDIRCLFRRSLDSCSIQADLTSKSEGGGSFQIGHLEGSAVGGLNMFAWSGWWGEALIFWSIL